MRVVRNLAEWARRAPRHRSFRLATAVLALAIAVGAVLLAQDVRSWRNTMRDDAIRYAISPTAPMQFTAPTYLPASISARLLAVDRDRRSLSALRFFALAQALDTRAGLTPAGEKLYQTAERSLSIVAQDPNPARAAQAYTMLSVILFNDSKGTFVVDTALYLAAISAMQNAARVAPGNGKVDADLELLLRQFKADTQKSGVQQANNQGSSNRGKTVGRGKGVPPLNAPNGDY